MFLFWSVMSTCAKCFANAALTSSFLASSERWIHLTAFAGDVESGSAALVFECDIGAERQQSPRCSPAL